MSERTLRITQSTDASGKYRAELSLEGKQLARTTVTASFEFDLHPQHREDLRWYLEDYLQYPHEPAPTVAKRIEGDLKNIGTELFRKVFHASDDARDLWATLRQKLDDTRVEIITSVAEANSIPWELIRDPKTDAALALRATSFVRSQPQPAQPPELPNTESGPIRILLVICRPSGDDDVPFRSVATQLIKGLGDQAGDLPCRIAVPPMPMQERVQLARALAEHHNRKLTDVDDWRPLLRFSLGNPLTITVLVGQALRDGLTTRGKIIAFVNKLRAGEAAFDDEMSEGRTRSLGASLSYGFENAFTEDQRRILALLHLFQGFVDVRALKAMGNPKADWCLPELRSGIRENSGAGADPNSHESGYPSFTREAGIALLDRAADVGLLTAHGGGYYTIHPALPWFFKGLFDEHFREGEAPAEPHGVGVDVAARREPRPPVAGGGVVDFFLELLGEFLDLAFDVVPLVFAQRFFLFGGVGGFVVHVMAAAAPVAFRDIAADLGIQSGLSAPNDSCCRSGQPRQRVSRYTDERIDRWTAKRTTCCASRWRRNRSFTRAG